MLIDGKKISDEFCMQLATYNSRNFTKEEYDSMIVDIKNSPKIDKKEKEIFLNLLKRAHPDNNFQNKYIGFN